MSSFRDALGGLKTSSGTSNYVLPTTPTAQGESSGFFSSLREGASSFVSTTGSTLSGYAGGGGNSDDLSTNQGEWFGLTLMQRWIGFGGCAFLAMFCFMMALMSLPMMVLSPQKFATAFSLGGLATIAGIALLRGPRAHTRHLLSRERMLFTVSYFGSVFSTLFFAAIVHSYLGTLLSVIVQIVALVWYVVSYFPGGTAGLQSTTRSLAGAGRTLLPF